MPSKQDKVQGLIERVTYANEENGYAVLKLKVSGHRDLVTVTGSIMNPSPGEELELQGKWCHHPKYGLQFSAEFCQRLAPTTAKGMQKYLGSGLIKGIGPVMAKRIVKRFGDDTLNVIEDSLERLQEVEGVGRKRISMIGRAWEEQKEIRQVMLFLQGHGMGVGFAVKIYKRYGNEAIKLVQENPYRLAMEVSGIGFLTADKLAAQLGFAQDSPQRAAAGVVYALYEMVNEGHVYVPYEELVELCTNLLGVSRSVVVAGFATMAEERRVVIEDLNTSIETYVENNKAVYLAHLYTAETGIARRLQELAHGVTLPIPEDDQGLVAWVQQALGMELAENQRQAVSLSLDSKVQVITGGPGTGKTTIIKAVLCIAKRRGKKVLLAAPTGRAAKRMSEATGHPAKTIHRMLSYSFKEGGFQKNSDNPLACDLLIVDEASMVDTVLMYHLLKAVPMGASLILVGDVNQLPSVGPGNVLGDIISSQFAAVVRLNKIFRQAQESSIIVNAHRVNQGQFPLLRNPAGQLDDFYFVEQEEPEKVLQTILRLVGERVPARFSFDSVDDIQVLTPMHRGVVGVANLNVELQKLLNPKGPELQREGKIFRVGDKVMQIRNNYDKDVFNGDIGRIQRIDKENQEIHIIFDDRRVLYEFFELDQVVLAYAVSVHKAQGSEYPVVIMPVLTEHYILLQRNLVYTGLTRGKQLVVLIGTRKAMYIALKNNKTKKRYTRLAERLAKSARKK